MQQSMRLHFLPAVATWAKAARLELALLAILIAIGAFLRVWQLDSIPPGLHGDEANTGLRAAEILRHGLIGPYDVVHGLGQPAGAEYWTAGVTWLLGDTVFTIRFAMALLGILTLPLAYALYRMIVGPQAALFGTALLAFSAWHLYHSRIALPPVSMPFVEVIVALLFLASLHWRQSWLFLATGVALGIGIYTYNSYPYFVVGLALFSVYWLLANRQLVTRRFLGQLALTAIAALATIIPMVSFIAQEPDPYFQYARSTSILRSEEFESGGLLAKMETISGSVWDFVQGMAFEPVPALYYDNIFTLLDPITAILAGLGILVALSRWRHPGITLSIIMLVAMSLPAILSTDTAAHSRRGVGIIPFVALFAALPFASLFAWAVSIQRIRLVVYAAAIVVALTILWMVFTSVVSGPVGGTVAAGAVISLVVLALLPEWPWVQQRMSLIPFAISGATLVAVLALNVNTYFYDFADDRRADYHFNQALVEAADYVRSLDNEIFVYFYANRWSLEYETMQYLAPDVQGEDYSIEFGPPTDGSDAASVLLPPPQEGIETVYLFVGDWYAMQLERVSREYPGGSAVEVADAPGSTVRAYHLP